MRFDVDTLGKLIKRPFFYFPSKWKLIHDNHSYRIKLKFPCSIIIVPAANSIWINCILY